MHVLSECLHSRTAADVTFLTDGFQFDIGAVVTLIWANWSSFAKISGQLRTNIFAFVYGSLISSVK